MTNLDIVRVDESYPISRAREVFSLYGVLILKAFLPNLVAAKIREILETRLDIARVQNKTLRVEEYPNAEFLLGDVLAIRELEPYDYIFLAPECVRMVSALLKTERPIYWGDSSIQFGEGGRGFHKDNVDRQDGTQDDWTRNYELVRCGFYFQDHSRYSGGLKVRLRSHNIASHLKGDIEDVLTETGDLVIWNMRLTHSGNNRRFRFAAHLPLHPRIERKLPSFLVKSEQKRRIAAFWSFGASGSHVDRYIDRMNERGDVKPYLQHARNREEAARLIARRGVAFRLPNDIYGELD